MVRGKPSCHEINCDDFMVPARWTGRVAIVVTGFIRTAIENMPTLQKIKEQNDVVVDVFYHVWYNATASCDVRALRKLMTFASVSFEPTACAWSWGGGSFPNHWHSVYNAFRALRVVFGMDPNNYGIILRTGTDVNYKTPSYFNFTQLWADYGPKNFAVLGYANGFDRHAFGTPSIMRAYSLYGPNEGMGCDSKFDSFPFQRFKRYGVTPTNFRCAPLYSQKNGVFRGTLLRPNDIIGCREHHQKRRRRLGVAPPRNFVAATHAFCSAHQFDTILNHTIISRNHTADRLDPLLRKKQNHPV